MREKMYTKQKKKESNRIHYNTLEGMNNLYKRKILLQQWYRWIITYSAFGLCAFNTVESEPKHRHRYDMTDTRLMR
jgi:hypothetical protein